MHPLLSFILCFKIGFMNVANEYVLFASCVHALFAPVACVSAGMNWHFIVTSQYRVRTPDLIAADE